MKGGQFSNQRVLLAWSFQFIQPTILKLLTSYNAAQLAPPSGVWPDNDYDTIWTVKLDAHGNLTVNNAMCEGINSADVAAHASAILMAARTGPSKDAGFAVREKLCPPAAPCPSTLL